MAIIEKSKLGGDCTWYGCVPSKSLIASSKAVHAVKTASRFGINIPNSDDVSVNMKAVKQRVHDNIQHIYQEDDSPEAMKKLGIDTIQGKAMFQSDKTLQVIDERTGEKCVVSAKYGVLICTGAGPKQPSSIKGLDSVKYITYENAFDIENVPEKLTVVGGGPIGVELAQAYSRLGAKVTLIAKTILPNEEPEVGECMYQVFQDEGITIVKSRLSSVIAKSGGDLSSHIVSCENGEQVEGDMLLLSLGRSPNVSGLGLSEIGVNMNDNGGIKVDANLQTSVRGVFAAGDCTGDRQFTHYAGYQGAVAARNILLPFTDPGTLKNVPSTTFTDPQVASVGLTVDAAKTEYGSSKVKVAFKEIKETDRGVCDGINEGFIKVVYLKRNYKVLGATIVSPVAGELIGEITMMMKTGMTFDMLATVMHTYPSHSFALQAMAAELYYEKLVKLKPILNFLKLLGL